MYKSIDGGRLRGALGLALVWLLLVPALPGLGTNTIALAEHSTDWTPFSGWSEAPLEVFWDLRIDPGAEHSGEEAWDEPEIHPFPSTYPRDGLCTNYNGFGFERQGVLADDRPWYPPTSTNFPFMITDPVAPGTRDIELYIQSIEARVYQGRRYHVRILNDINQVHKNGLDPRLQIVVNHVIDYGYAESGFACFTLYFPPYFNANYLGMAEVEETSIAGTAASAEAAIALRHSNRYPILFNTNGWGASNNLSFKSDGSPGSSEFLTNPALGYFPNTVLDGWEYDGQGFVYIQSNGGGDGSVGFTEGFLKDVSRMIDQLHREFYCDRNRVVTVGGSRGGGVALQVAVNPHAGQPGFQTYNVLGIFSRTAPLGGGTMSQIPITNNPTLNALYNAEMGPSGGRYDNDPPPIEDPAPVLGAPMGTTDIQEANDWSPDGIHVENLRGKYIFLMHGTQDSWMSEKHWLSFERQLSLDGIPHTAFCFLNTGHHLPGGAGPWQSVFADFVTSMMDDVNFDPSVYVPPDAPHGIFEHGRDYYWKGDLHEPTNWENVVHLPDQLELPFSATIPYRMGRVVNDGPPDACHEPGCIQLHGSAGRAWIVEFYDDTGPLPDPWHMRTGTFKVKGEVKARAETVDICWGYEGLPRIDTAQYYEYRIWYEDLDGVMQEVTDYTNYASSPGNRLPARTWITEDQPYPSDPLEGYYPAWSGGKAYMLSLGINWCETCPQD